MDPNGKGELGGTYFLINATFLESAASMYGSGVVGVYITSSKLQRLKL
jgi:hypothetical protein